MRAIRLLLLAGSLAAVSACSKQSGDANVTATSSEGGPTLAPAPAGTHVRGVVQAVQPNGVAVRTYGGSSSTVPVDAQTRYAWVVSSSLSTVKDGDFVGTATTGPGNALRAVELVIFPAAMKGSGEGHYAWDNPGVVAAQGGNRGGSSAMTNGTVTNQSTMTNGTVTGQSAMTNGTVTGQSAMTNGTVTGGSGQAGGTMLTITYKGGKAQVLVPPGTPIVRFEPAQRSILAAGQKIFAVVTPDSPDAKFVAVGKDGLTPPM